MIGKKILSLIKSLQNKKYRIEYGLFVAEGPKVVTELMSCFHPQILIATSKWLSLNNRMVENAISKGCDVLVTDEDSLHRASLLSHPQHVICLFEIPKWHVPSIGDIRQKLVLCLDGVQDPGNVGTIIRVADWFGIHSIICSYDTANVFNPKVVQATMGSIARVEVTYTELPMFAKSLNDTIPIYGMSLDGEDITTQRLIPYGLLVMGNESVGISLAMQNYLTQKLFIPKHESSFKIDSLNVATATAITCYEFHRRRKFFNG